MTEENKVLIKCSRCKSSKLESYYDINTKGCFYKTCVKCRKSRTKKSNVNEDNLIANDTSPSNDLIFCIPKTTIDNDPVITIERLKFITNFLQLNSKCEMKWLGIVDLDKSDLKNAELPNYMPLTGDEYIVEYHLFETVEFGKDGPPIITRWRLLKPGIKSKNPGIIYKKVVY
jgi:hypothetical protein